MLEMLKTLTDNALEKLRELLDIVKARENPRKIGEQKLLHTIKVTTKVIRDIEKLRYSVMW